MSLSKNTLIRLRVIDSCLCRRQRLWTLEDLREACEEALYEYEGIRGISLRTVQRDIELMRSDKLGYNAPIVVRSRKYYMYDDPEYSITRLPLSKEDLAELSSAMDIIRHYGGFQGMSGQEDILARMQDRIRTQSEHQQVVYIETNTRLKGIDFLGTLYEYIVAKQSIQVTYKSFKAPKESVFRISPYFLKEFNNRWFLYGYSYKMSAIQNLALDRIIDVDKDTKNTYVENSFVDPEKFFGEMVGVTRVLDSEPERVTLIVTPDQAPYVLTKPIHDSQQLIRKLDDGSAEVSLYVILNHELESRLLSYGPGVEVLSPPHLRSDIAAKVLALASQYSENGEKY